MHSLTERQRPLGHIVVLIIEGFASSLVALTTPTCLTDITRHDDTWQAMLELMVESAPLIEYSGYRRCQGIWQLVTLVTTTSSCMAHRLWHLVSTAISFDRLCSWQKLLLILTLCITVIFMRLYHSTYSTHIYSQPQQQQQPHYILLSKRSDPSQMYCAHDQFWQPRRPDYPTRLITPRSYNKWQRWAFLYTFNLYL